MVKAIALSRDDSADGGSRELTRALGNRWWERLALDFSKQNETFELGPFDRTRVNATATSDVAFRTVGACLLGSLALPLGYHPRKLRSALEDLDFYGRFAESGDASLFFRKPPRGVLFEMRPARRPLFRPVDGACEDLRFESPFEPVNPRQREGYLRHEKNRFAHARHWRHHGAPRPTIVAIHGFSADFYHLNEWFFALPWLYQLGCDVLLFTLPFHGQRQTRFSPFSGHGFFAGGMSRINEAFAQAVFDVRIFLDWLEATGVSTIGVTGVSLGGYTSALLAAVEDRLQFVIPNVPVVSLADLMLEWSPIGAVVRASLALLKKSLVDARHLLAASTPLTYPPLLPRDRLMIIGGIGDRLAPPKHARLLWEHWGRCPIYWFPGSHLVHLDRGAYLRQVRKFLREIGFLEDLARMA